MKKVSDDFRRYDDDVVSKTRRGVRETTSWIRLIADAIKIFRDIAKTILDIASWFSRR